MLLGSLWCVFAACLAFVARGQEVEMEVAPDVEVTQRPQFLYSTISPKLRINGKGFGKDPSGIKLDFIPALVKRKAPIYNLSATDTVLVLGLRKGFQWPSATTSPDEESSILFLQSIVVNQHGPQNQLTSPVPVATIIEPPSVIRGEEKIIYMTATTRFLINGTNFREGTTSLVFDPPLVKDVDYVLAVRSPTCLQLALRTGRRWRSDGEPGPLRLRRVDTGAGPLRIDPKFGGVIVAEVQADLGGHGVTVNANEAKIMYQTDPSLVVEGSGFAHVREVEEKNFGNPRLRFGNGLLGRGVNYSISEFDDHRLELVLKPGSMWRRNGANLPAPLTLLAVDAGSGYVAVGATEARKGQRVATVFEAPRITPSPLTTLFKTHSAQLWITGAGFTRPGSAPGLNVETKLEFEPALKKDTDYLLTVFNRTHMLVRLREGRAWSKDPGPLYVTACDSGPGSYANFKPAAVAHVVPDADPHESGLEVTRTNHQVLYQTPAIRKLVIQGSSLSSDAKLVFDPPLQRNVDYKVDKATEDSMVLSLLAGRMWRQTAGHLMLMSIDTGKGPVELAHGTGIVVADIAANPTISSSALRITSSLSKRIQIYGTGFSIDGTELTLEPTSRAAYDVEAVYPNEIVLKLKEGRSWGNVPAGQESVELVVTKIDTSAGEYIFQDADGTPRPVVVAVVVPDSAATTSSGEQVRCDDTCMWANDGVCDDGSRGSRAFGGGGGQGGGGGGGAFGGDLGGGGKRSGAWWEDDDLGGWYADEREEAPAYEDKYDYGYYDDQYGYYGDDTAMPACILGTDCTDCGGPLNAIDFADTGAKQGDWDDDEWFDDDSEEWWDDDYDFGDGWPGFEDDPKDGDRPIGIIKSEHPTKKVNKRHQPKGKKSEKDSPLAILETYPIAFALLAIAALVGGCFACSTFSNKNSDNRPESSNPCLGPRKQAQA
mmetsp:Transcript_15654/g.51230  ORF Transcript_15654/g.51230 Transcript_15654/m.51230 type:complete len:939 (+) Transcript_15654:110-2926(+)